MKTKKTSSARRRNRTRARENPGPRVPSFRHHEATGQGYVVLNGQAIYLGRHDEPAAEQKYHQVIAEWMAGEAPSQGLPSAGPACPAAARHQGDPDTQATK